MNRFVFTIFVASLIISCGDKTGDSFSSSYLLNQYGNIRIPMYDAVSEPVFYSEDSFWYALDKDKRILYHRDISGNPLDQIILYFYPAVQNISHMILGADGGTALFTVSSGDPKVRSICRMTFSSSSHDAFQLDGSGSFMIPNPLNLYITDLSEPWGNQVAYLGTELNDGSSTATQKVYIYNYGTGTTQVVDLDPGICPLSPEGSLAGNYYYRIDSFPDNERPNEIGSFIICQRIETSESVFHSFKIFRSDGSVSFDASGAYEYQEIGGIRWLNKEELILAVKKDGLWQIISVNNGGDEKVFYKGTEDIYTMTGLSLSPHKERCLTQISYRESDSYSEIMILNLQ